MSKEYVIKKLGTLSEDVRNKFPNFRGFIAYGSFVRSNKYNDIDLICVFEKRLPEGDYEPELLGILDRPSGLTQYVEKHWCGDEKLDLAGYVDIYLDDSPIKILKQLWFLGTSTEYYIGNNRARKKLKIVSKLEKLL